MSDVDQRIKVISTEILVGAYAEFKRQGELSDPGLVAAAYAEVKQLLDVLDVTGVADIEYRGSDLVRIINEAKNDGSGEKT
jgi:hypothetical protein